MTENLDHRPYRLLAAAAVDGRISAEEAAELEEHLASCRACRLDQAAMVRDHVWLATPVPVAPPHPRVRAAVLGEARRTAPSRPWAALVAAGLAVVLVGAGLVAWGPRFPPSGAGGTGAPTASTALTARPSDLGTSVPVGACAPLPPDLAAWWPLDGSGHDVAGGDDVATHGAARFSPGVVGQALTLDGVTAYAEVPDGAALDLATDDFTITLWVRFESLNGEPVLIEKWHDQVGGFSSQQGWTLQKTLQSGLAFYAADGSEAFGLATDALPLRAGTWYQVAVRRAAGDLSILVNGVRRGHAVRSEGPIDLSLNTPLMLGRRGDDAGDFLHGQLDEVQLVIGRALSDQEIEVIYSAGSTGTCHI